jgi:hypothetical protein
VFDRLRRRRQPGVESAVSLNSSMISLASSLFSKVHNFTAGREEACDRRLCRIKIPPASSLPLTEFRIADACPSGAFPLMTAPFSETPWSWSAQLNQ